MSRAWLSRKFIRRCRISKIRKLQSCHGIFLRLPQKLTSEKKLSQDFLTNLYLLGLEERPEQLKFARFMEEALDQQEPSFLEAQTGLGKTFGYLLPHSI